MPSSTTTLSYAALQQQQQRTGSGQKQEQVLSVKSQLEHAGGWNTLAILLEQP
jgi:hypothetical protein